MWVKLGEGEGINYREKVESQRLCSGTPKCQSVEGFA